MQKTTKREPVKYLVKDRSLIGNEIFEAGAIAEYDGLPAENLEPQCDEGRARAEEYRISNEKRVSQMMADHKESAVGDPAQFLANFAKFMQEENARRDEKMDAAIATLAEAMAKLASQVPAAAPAPAAEEKPVVEEKPAKAK